MAEGETFELPIPLPIGWHIQLRCVCSFCGGDYEIRKYESASARRSLRCPNDKCRNYNIYYLVNCPFDKPVEVIEVRQ